MESTTRARTRLPALAFAAVGLALVALAAPRPATAAHTVTGFTLTPASPQAGASVDASSSTSLSYANTTEDVKKTVGHFAPGLLANPETVPHCPQALFLADACPADTKIGKSEATLLVPPSPLPITEHGDIYNQELLENEAGRLGIIVRSAAVPGAKLFLTAPFYVRTNGDYGLDGILDNIPRDIDGAVNIQITRLSFTLFGTVQGRNFTRGPTSCTLKVSTGEAFGYEHTDPVSGPSDSYTPTNCEALPFKPTFAMSVGSRGTTGERQHPPMTVTVTQQPGEAGILGNGVTLPFEIGPHLAALGVSCSTAHLAADACPAGSKVGTATATSTFLATPLKGPVYLAQQPGVVIPGLVANLKGRVPIKVRIATRIVAGKYIQSTVSDVPDLPVSTFTLNLDGGKEGVLESKFDLCYRSRYGAFRTLNVDVTFAAHSGARTASKPRIAVEGCGPSATASLRRATGRRATLKLTVERHPDAENINRLDVTLPRGLALVSKRMKGKGVSVTAAASGATVQAAGKRKLQISRLPGKGARRVTISLRRGAVRASAKVRRLARKGKRPRLRIKVVSVDVRGERFTAKATAKAKR
jgi:hypothetical protein